MCQKCWENAELVAFLLMIWEEAYDNGCDIPPDLLTDDNQDVIVEVAEGIEALKHMRWLTRRVQVLDKHGRHAIGIRS